LTVLDLSEIAMEIEAIVRDADVIAVRVVPTGTNLLVTFAADQRAQRIRVCAQCRCHRRQGSDVRPTPGND
jgi:hypothetical protein